MQRNYCTRQQGYMPGGAVGREWCAPRPQPKAQQRLVTNNSFRY